MKASECFKLAAVMTAAVMGLAGSVWADSAAGVKSAIDAATGGYDLEAAVSGDTVTVTGSLTAGIPTTGNFLTLNISAGVTVVWRATLKGAINSEGHALINISGGGGSGASFIAESGVIENTGGGAAIINNSTCVITVSGDARITSKYMYGERGTIYLTDVGTSTAARLIIAGGTVENILQGNDGIYFGNAVHNLSTGAINVSGGTVSATKGKAIYNRNRDCTINISGGTVSAANDTAIYNGLPSGFGTPASGAINISGGTVSATSGSAVYNCNGGKVNVSGGTVSATTGKAIYNASTVALTISGGTVSATTGKAILHASTGAINVSGSAKITSANTNSASNEGGTILINGGTLNINGGTVENTTSDTSYANAIYTGSSTPTINISDGTVKSLNGYAIYCFNMAGINISGGTVSSDGSGKAAVYVYSEGSVKITGGTVEATQSGSYAIYSGFRRNSGTTNVTITLGGSPTITGRIYMYPQKLSVINTANDPDIFAPAEKLYTLDFPADRYVADSIAVMGGRSFINNFTLHDPNYYLTGAAANLVIAKALKVSFDLNHVIFSEDFEGNTHSFTLENGEQTNKWAVGTAAAAGGTKSAYISNDNGTSNAYATSSQSVVHMYRDVTLPAPSEPCTLSFNWRGDGELRGITVYDYLRVLLAATSAAPAAGTEVDGILLKSYYGYDDWQKESINIQASNLGTAKRLVFTWLNNASGGTQPPIAVDNIVLKATVAGQRPAPIIGVRLGSTISSAQKPSTSGFVRPDYVSDGNWYTSPACETEFVFGDGGTAVQQDMTLYLKWLPLSATAHAITFDANGGTVSPATAITGEDGKLASLPVPTKEGSAFNGWFTSATGGEAVTTNTAFDKAGTIYAQWTVHKYAVTFSAGENGALAAAADGSAITSGAEVEHGKSVVFTAIPESGYGVIGWTLNGAAVSGNTENTYTLAGVSAASVVTVSFGKSTSVSMSDRVIPTAKPNEEATVIAPMVILAGEFTAGPNPVNKSSNGIAFFRQGKRISGTLVVYDASGNAVKKIQVKDNAVNNQARRKVGAWDLTDKKGRPVSEGTYLLKGVIKTSDGKSEKVSVIVGVR